MYIAVYDIYNYIMGVLSLRHVAISYICTLIDALYIIHISYYILDFAKYICTYA